MYDRLCALTEVIAFDKADHDRLLAVAALRRKLPRLLSEYQIYFDRRLNVYTAYVKVSSVQISTRDFLMSIICYSADRLQLYSWHC